MAVIKITSSKSATGALENYLKQEEKTEELLISGKDCDGNNFSSDFKAIKDLYDKNEGRQHFHIVQSFIPGEVTPQAAHEIGVKLAEKCFKGHQVGIVTHIDKEHVHNHLVVNIVSFETGLKHQSGPKELKDLRETSDKLCLENNLTIIEEKYSREGDIRSYNLSEYKSFENHFSGKEESWKLNIYNAIDKAKQTSKTKEEFISELNNFGVKTNWEDSRKYITFEDKEKNKIRDKNLEKTFSTECNKDFLQRVFKLNLEKLLEREKAKLNLEKQEIEIKKKRSLGFSR